jgi:hypothetical protein
MDYSNFRFHCDVDWIQLALNTQRSTHAWRLQKCSEFSFVEACDPLTKEPYSLVNTPSTHFRAKMQDPKNWRSIAHTVEVLSRAYPLAEQPKVIGIEVTLDAYSNGASSEELVRLTAHMYKFLTDPVSNNHRTYHSYTGSVRGISNFDVLVNDLSGGHQIGIGKSSADRYQHLYFKTTDSVREGGATLLPVEQHRARLEITLRGAALPIKTLDEWESFDFRSLTRYFNFRMFKPVLNKWAASALEIRARQTGRLTKEQKVNYRTRREFSFSTLADKRLNDIAKGSLRRLSGRW